ncbi:MAG: hypothetical protein N2999_07230 [Proteobacteria bacterium]|nr:hypothetical protein [Pseudomonadota bacterium]
MNNRIYLISGDDEYQKEQIEEIIKKIGVSSENIDNIISGDKEWQTIADEVRTYSLFGTPRLFIIKDVDIFKSEEKIEDIIDKAFSLYQSKDYERAGKEVLKALKQLELSEEELDSIISSPSVLEGYLGKSDINISFITDLIKKSLVKIESLRKNEEFNFASLISNIPEGHFVILTTKELDKRTKNFKLFQNAGTFLEKKESKISSKELRNRIDNEIDSFIKDTKKHISPEDLIYLKELAFESSFLKKKLEKLALVIEKKESITREDIDNTFDDDTFPDSQLIPELIRKKDLNSLLKIILNPRNTKADFIKLTGYLRSLLRNSIAIREFSANEEYDDFYSFEKRFYKKYFDILPKETLKSQHPYYLFQCYLNFKDFQLRDLKRFYLLLFEIDRNLKSTQITPKDLFIDFFTELFSTRN